MRRNLLAIATVLLTAFLGLCGYLFASRGICLVTVENAGRISVIELTNLKLVEETKCKVETIPASCDRIAWSFSHSLFGERRFTCAELTANAQTVATTVIDELRSWETAAAEVRHDARTHLSVSVLAGSGFIEPGDKVSESSIFLIASALILLFLTLASMTIALAP